MSVLFRRLLHPQNLSDQFLRLLFGLIVLSGIVFGAGFVVAQRAEAVLSLRTKALEAELEAELILQLKERFGNSLPSVEQIQQLIPNVNENIPYLEMLQAAADDAFPQGASRIVADVAASQELGGGIRAVSFSLSAQGDQNASIRLLQNFDELPVLIALTSYGADLRTGEDNSTGPYAIAASGLVYLRVP